MNVRGASLSIAQCGPLNMLDLPAGQRRLNLTFECIGKLQKESPKGCGSGSFAANLAASIGEGYSARCRPAHFETLLAGFSLHRVDRLLLVGFNCAVRCLDSGVILD